jgi:hypothetical protein
MRFCRFGNQLGPVIPPPFVVGILIDCLPFRQRIHVSILGFGTSRAICSRVTSTACFACILQRLIELLPSVLNRMCVRID